MELATDTVEKYLARWDTYNVKTILGASSHGATVEEIQEDIVAAGKLSEDDLNYFISLSTVNDVLDELQEDRPAHTRGDQGAVRRDRDAGTDRGFPGQAVLRTSRWRHCGQDRTGEAAHHLPEEGDERQLANLMTLLKLKREGIETDRMGRYTIDGGQELTLKELNRLSAMESFEATIAELTKLSFYKKG